MLASEISSQMALHRPYGGVVPELASRDHVQRLLPLVRQTLAEAGVGRVDGNAYTAGPGLIGALMVGALFGRSLALAWGVPAVAVHHLEGHLMAPMLEDDRPGYPFLALLVSGGHTLLIEVAAFGRYRILGESLDDAAGEAFDKTAKALGLGYPGGAALAALAEQGQRGRFLFPRPMLDRPGLDFSFSGLKTAAVLALARAGGDAAARADLARAFEEAVVDTLVAKTLRALDQTGLKALVVAGGVGANRRLRADLAAAAQKRGARVFYPRVEFCTDNAAMIARAGIERLQAGEVTSDDFAPRARWSLEELRPPER